VDVFLDCCEAVAEPQFSGVVSKNYELAAIGFDEEDAEVASSSGYRAATASSSPSILAAVVGLLCGGWVAAL